MACSEVADARAVSSLHRSQEKGQTGDLLKPLSFDIEFHLPTAIKTAFKEILRHDLLQEPGVPRSPAVFGAIISYFEQFFETVGISLGNQQVGRIILNA